MQGGACDFFSPFWTFPGNEIKSTGHIQETGPVLCKDPVALGQKSEAAHWTTPGFSGVAGREGKSQKHEAKVYVDCVAGVPGAWVSFLLRLFWYLLFLVPRMWARPSPAACPRASFSPCYLESSSLVVTWPLMLSSSQDDASQSPSPESFSTLGETLASSAH